jgi:hypothetical protein
MAGGGELKEVTGNSKNISSSILKQEHVVRKNTNKTT